VDENQPLPQLIIIDGKRTVSAALSMIWIERENSYNWYSEEAEELFLSEIHSFVFRLKSETLK
jgi:hypothetical protein